MRRRGLRRARVSPWTLLAVALLALPGTARAQEAARPSPWKRNFEAQGSLFVGNNPQTVFTTRSQVSFADSTLESGVDVRFTYGETSKDGHRRTHQRWWLATVNLDAFPYARWSPFMLGTFESSFERRLLQRWNGGLGAKYTPVTGDRTSISVSLAVLAERRIQLSAENVRQMDGLARYSARFRARHQINGKASMQLETFYQPEVQELAAYLYNSTVSLQYRMNEILRLQVSWRDSYDSGAELRGATSNYDGQLVVGIGAQF